MTEPVRISDTRAMELGSAVPTDAVVFQCTVAGAEVMVGRVPLNRYGGEKIWTLRWSGTPGSPPPPET